MHGRRERNGGRIGQARSIGEATLILEVAGVVVGYGGLMVLLLYPVARAAGYLA